MLCNTSVASKGSAVSNHLILRFLPQIPLIGGDSEIKYNALRDILMISIIICNHNSKSKIQCFT